MGFLRFLLAMTVVFAHLHFIHPIFGDSRFAVQMFFIISGFYISMIWSEKYSSLKSPISAFYLSRALRIYPLYYIVLIISILIAWFGLSSGHISALMALLAYPVHGALSSSVHLPQLTILGMDIYPFLGRLDDGSLEFLNQQFAYPRPYIFEYFFIPQAWSLSLELMFYLIAPFILKRTRLLIGLAITSLTLRLILWKYGFNQDPWTFRALPLELSLFIAGALSQKLSTHFGITIKKTAHANFIFLAIGAIPIVLTLTIKFALLTIGESAYWLYYAITLTTLPFLFHATKLYKFDRALGELSYPVYISHWLVISTFFVLDIPLENNYPIVIFTIILESFLLNIIQLKIDIFRNRLAMSKSI
ncbi:acyltransferase [Curvibacter sp. CHRR-16]|uniref:acyltransferase family protein n=1 Tax=Curvibacter sp. CHRR-16 TaxID=2835872 RepID=UPI001BDA2B3C|nr:acyltransferase [Curvibacter sp. CHRR-16]MBT0570187.1 acyltransferase [Curvibacter sp. CHRR-16]